MRFYNQQHRFYCGVDLHTKTMYLCILDQADQIGLGRQARRFAWPAERHGGAFWGAAALSPPQCPGVAKAWVPDPENVFGTASCRGPKPKRAGAVSAKWATAKRKLHMTKKRIFRIRGERY
jgi:hypothetical protein